MEKKVLNEMFENLLHIGNKTNFWSPKMKSYIYGSVNGVHIINLTKTVNDVERVKAELKELSAAGKKILFVATKLQARFGFAELAEQTGHYYVNEKWVPGLLTNFRTVKRRIATYVKLLADSKSGSLDILTKKEKAAKLLELEKLDKAFKGLKEMKKLPDAIFVVDGMYEEQTLKEANTLKIKTFSVFNTNGDIDLADSIIAANTNSMKAMDYLAASLKDSLPKAKAERKAIVKKVAPKKVSGEKKAPAKKTEEK